MANETLEGKIEKLMTAEQLKNKKLEKKVPVIAP